MSNWSLANCFSYSNSILTLNIVQNGVGVNMLKIGSKRRRPTNEVLMERHQSKMKDQDLQAKLGELRAMETALNAQKQELAAGREATAVINKLLEQGHLKQRDDGSWFLPSQVNPQKK